MKTLFSILLLVANACLGQSYPSIIGDDNVWVQPLAQSIWDANYWGILKNTLLPTNGTTISADDATHRIVIGVTAGGGSGTVTSVGLTTTIPGLSVAGSPVVEASSMTLSGIIGEAAVDSAIARDLEVSSAVSTHASTTNGVHGMTLFGALIAAQANAAAARTQLGLAIGSDVQAYDSDLAAVAGLATTGIEVRTGSGTQATRTITGTSGRLLVTNGDGVSGNPTLDIDTNSLAASINSGSPNGSGAFVHWSKLVGVPAGFADNTDDGGGGGSAIGVNSGAGGAVTNFPDSSSVTWTASSGSATAKTAHRNLASWNAAQMLPCTTAAAQASFAVRGAGVPVNCFDPTTANIVLLQAEVPSGFNLAGGLEFILKVAPDFANPGTSNVVFQVQYQKLSAGSATVDSSSYSGAIAVTNRLTGAAGVVTNLTFSLASWSGWSAGETYQIELQKLAGSASDDSTNKACVVSAQLNVISQ